MLVPCRQCRGCRDLYAREWTARIIHEQLFSIDSCFLTLTYDEKNNPESLNKEDITKFFKRLRYYKTENKIRYLQIGEYGDKGRPHHHAAVFNLKINDIVAYRTSKKGFPMYVSKEIKKIWKHGFVTIQELTIENARYIVNYMYKQFKGKEEDVQKHYDGKMPPYCTMSRRPGIGKKFIEEYTNDVYNNDFVWTKKGKIKPPRYYDKYLENIDPERYNKIKENRKENMNNEELDFRENLRKERFLKKRQNRRKGSYD